MVATAEKQGEKVIMQGNGFEGFCYETAVFGISIRMNFKFKWQK